MSQRAVSRRAPCAPSRHHPRRPRAWAGSLALALASSLSLLAPAQPLTASAGAAPCTAPADLAPAQLYGRWQLSLWPQGASSTGPDARTVNGTLAFERHPEFPDSVRGRLLQRQANGLAALEALVSGDVVQGEFNLDESADGIRIDAVWTGDVTPAGCGQEIRGVRLPAQGLPGEPMNFVLRKAPGWE